MERDEEKVQAIIDKLKKDIIALEHEIEMTSNHLHKVYSRCNDGSLALAYDYALSDKINDAEMLRKTLANYYSELGE